MPEPKLEKMTSGERLLVELNVAVKYLTDAFAEFKRSMDEKIQGLQAGTISRKEFDLLRAEADKTLVNHASRIEVSEKAIETLQKDSATLAGQIKLALWVMSAGMVILGIIAPILTAKYIH